ncbi:MAG: hypothetical protein JST68_27805 [Bacteroidetes bacterium]|nr:hypothetical protein [Bacteroidota bacterium]
MDTMRIVRIHGLILIGCSLIGLFGYYFQNHFFQITACIPAAMGLLVAGISFFGAGRVRDAVLFVIVLAFGVMLTRMSLKFVFQPWQPLRKRIYFPVMAMSSIVTVFVMVRNYLLYKKNKQL